MRISRTLLLAASLSIATPAVLHAQAPEISTRTSVYTSDGLKIGRIDRIVANADGSPSAVKIIYDGRYITIPAGTLSSGEKGLVTTLTKKDVSKL